MVLSVAAVATLIYHWFSVVSYWIGCPTSPEFLSLTLLTTLRVPPLSLTVSALLLTASLGVCAILIWSVPNPAAPVMA